MCGISGQFNYRNGEPVDPGRIRLMAESIRHRGPDDDGIHISGPLGLGFRRLSIIDLAGGHQPMSDVEKSIWVVFNGEIYNFKELRLELEKLGHRFQTNSDTEVIVHGYKEWGMEILSRLNGMFGLAIWDENKKRLVVARDAMGIKPVYYHDAGGTLTFGSEIRAVLAGLDHTPGVNPEAMSLFLQFRYTPAPLTIYNGIRKLAPGTLLLIERGQCREERWYRYTPEPFDSTKSESEAYEELLDLYRAAMRRHLLSDVPVGILLSGGLDSGLLLALMNESGQNWPAYTVGYGESFQDDELADAAESAKLLGARHIPVKLDQTEFENALPKIVASLEEPIAASSIVPMYFVCQRARQDVKVVLVGQGPDELFGGYKRHLGVHYGEGWRQLPEGLRHMTRSVVNRLPRREALKRGVYSLGVEDRMQRYEHVFSLVPREQIQSLFRVDIQNSTGKSGVSSWNALLPQMAGLDELNAFQMLEIRSSLPDELLMYGDKLSMAHGLEARVPYLDREVVEYAQRLPASFKVRHGQGKWLHRKVSKNYLPSPILKRKKRGFAVNVVDDWFNSTVAGEFPKILQNPDSLIFEWLQPKAVGNLLSDHRSGRQDNHKLLFSLIMLEQFLRLHTPELAHV